MCIILDTNCFGDIFKSNSPRYSEYKPVLEWILTGKGKFIIGGTKYLEELKKHSAARRFMVNLRKFTNKLVLLEQNKVDQEQKRIEGLLQDPDFDDPHLPAMVIVSRCRLICSRDSRSVKYVTNRKLYPKDIKVPKYYTGAHNKGLLCDENIDARYKPLEKSKCSKNVVEIMNASIG